MFNLYFSSQVAARLRALPDVDWLQSFLSTLHDRGYARLTVQFYMRQAELFGRWLRRRRRTFTSVTDADVRAFAGRGLRDRVRSDARATVRHLLRHLRERRLIPSRPAPTPARIERVIAAYDAHLRDVAGLAEATRFYRRRYGRELMLAVFGNKPIRWRCVRPVHIRTFITAYGLTGRTAAAQVAGGSTRSFLRWLQFLGEDTHDLVAAVPRSPRWRLAPLPPVLTNDQLQALLASFDHSTVVGRRDYAMALCITDLGLRVSEVVDLKIRDLDVVNGTMRLEAGKSRRERVLPMPPRIRRAVLDYIRRGRPRTAAVHLFVRHRIPIGSAVTRELVRGVIRRAYAVVPGCATWTGTHRLRSTAASRLLHAGGSLKQIADILGHRSIDTTAVYAKVDRDRLSTVALPWPTGKEARS